METILQVLDRQWPDVATSPEARRALIRWANDHEVLAGMRDLRDVLESRRDPRVAREVLSVLAGLAPTDELAARALLQVLLPGLVRLVGTHVQSDAEAQDDLVALAWERIRTYPSTRPGSVAANVILDVRKQYVKLRRDARTVPLFLCAEPFAEASSPEDQAIAVMGVEEIAAAQRQGFVSAVVLEAIVRTRLGGESLAEVAADQGLETEVLCQRRWRAERRLRTLPLAG